MRVVAVIQARMSSNRLPGKVLYRICGKTMLARVVQRTARATTLNDLIVATSTRLIDDAIVSECEGLNVSVFRGSEIDVLDRFYRASLCSKAEIVVRITADCPLIDPVVIDKVVNSFLNSKIDYASNTLVRTYPRGLDVEVMGAPTLTIAWRNAGRSYEREHVTPYIYEHPDLFKLLSVTGSGDFSRYRWTVDTPEDLDFVRQVYERLENNYHFGWQDVLNLCEKEPFLPELNRNIRQKPLGNS